jgi:Xaa-Pro dipeptidase
MDMNRRNFIKASIAGAAGSTLTAAGCQSTETVRSGPFSELHMMTDGIVPISDEDRRARIEKAQRLMVQKKIEAIYLDSGTSMFYFTGIRWWSSERMFAVVLPARGEPAYICPKFEEDRARELIRIGDDVRTWEEDESPYKRVAQVFKDRSIRTGCIGMEECVRFFLFDGVRKEASHLNYISADPITVECRVRKSSKEIALMQRASDITIAAYKAVIPRLREGMMQSEFSDLASSAHRALGAGGGIGAQFGIASSFPHGTSKPNPLRPGDIVLMDGGCSVDGYKSDISRTVVFGNPTSRQREMWDLASKAKAAAFAAAGVGIPCEYADAEARRVYVENGFGPDYRLPGCPHRTGHGIGLDGHEWINLVRGNRRPMETGMCFSNEPMVVLPGEFGVRLEDCFYITEDGPVYFSDPSPAIDRPFA